jgi:hypothetical protein
MSYLVQRYFKNAFKDFRIQDVEYYEDLKDVQPGSVLYKDSLVLITKEVYEANPSLIEDLKEADFEIVEDHDNYLVCPSCAKVWNLVNGNGLGKAKKMYYVNGEWADKNTAVQCISKLFQKYGLLRK